MANEYTIKEARTAGKFFAYGNQHTVTFFNENGIVRVVEVTDNKVGRIYNSPRYLKKYQTIIEALMN